MFLRTSGGVVLITSRQIADVCEIAMSCLSRGLSLWGRVIYVLSNLAVYDNFYEFTIGRYKGDWK